MWKLTNEVVIRGYVRFQLENKMATRGRVDIESSSYFDDHASDTEFSSEDEVEEVDIVLEGNVI